MTDDDESIDDDIFARFDKFFADMIKNAGFGDSGVFPWSTTRQYRSDRNIIRSQSVSPREEIFRHESNVTIVMELGYGYDNDNINVGIIENDGRRILQVISDDGALVRRYALAQDMTGEFDWRVMNGILEVVLAKTVEVVDLE